MAAKIAPLPDRALIRVDGEWRPFLHNLLTQDMETQAPGSLRYAALLAPQGRLLHDLFVFAEENGAVLDVAAAGREALVNRLTLYRLRAKVRIQPIEGGVHARFSEDASANDDLGYPTADSDWTADPRLPRLGARALNYGGSATATPDAYDAHRMTLGVPDPAVDGREGDYALELNLDLLNGVDFKKGCFVGQETTSRMKRRGPVKTRAVPLAFLGPAPAPGTELLSGDPSAGALRVGEIRSGREGRAIAVVRLDRAGSPALTAGGRPVRLDPPAWLPMGATVAA